MSERNEWQANGIGNLTNDRTLEDLLDSCTADCCVAVEFRNYHPSLDLGAFYATAFVGAYRNLGNPTIIRSNTKDAALLHSVGKESGVDALLSFTIRFDSAISPKFRILPQVKFLLALRITTDKRKNVFAIAFSRDLILDKATFEIMLMPGSKENCCVREEASEDAIELDALLFMTELKIKAKMTSDNRSKMIVEFSRF